jgi:N-acetylglutamate synthase
MDLRIEELSLSAWPALQTMVYDGWILRFAEGYSKRSNSVNPLYASALSLDEKIAVCEGAYASRGLPTVFKILGCEEHKALDDALADRGYARIDETAVRTLSLALPGPERGPGPPCEGVELGSAFDDAWIDAFCACSRVPDSRGIVGRILANVLPGTIVAGVRAGGEIVGCGYGALDRGCVGIFDIVVREDMRGRGLGRAIVASILERAADLGAGRSYLQVVSGNVPAEGLYDRLGFREAYRYWYRKKDR